MNRKIYWFAAVALLLFASSAQASFHSRIDEEYCSLLATHIVMVSEGDKIDGQVTVLESWRGDLQTGQTLNLPPLARFKSPESRLIKCISPYFLPCDDEKEPHYVSGSRILLFLIEKPRKMILERWSYLGSIWFEKDNAYCLWDNESFGTLSSTEAQMYGRIKILLRERERLAEVLSMEDGATKRQALESFIPLRSRILSRLAAIEMRAMTKAQQTSSPLTKLPTNSDFKCKSDCMAAIFSWALSRELEHWQAFIPQVRDKWYQSARSREEAEEYRTHYADTEWLVGIIQMAWSSESRQIIEKLREIWLTMPDTNRRDNIVKWSDFLLGKL